MNIDFSKDEYKDLSTDAKAELQHILSLYQPVLNKLNTIGRSDDLANAKTQLENSFDSVVKSVTDAAAQLKADKEGKPEDKEKKEIEDGTPLDATDKNDKVNNNKQK